MKIPRVRSESAVRLLTRAMVVWPKPRTLSIQSMIFGCSWSQWFWLNDDQDLSILNFIFSKPAAHQEANFDWILMHRKDEGGSVLLSPTILVESKVEPCNKIYSPLIVPGQCLPGIHLGIKEN